MEFCPECGNMMTPRKKNGAVFWYCETCNLMISADGEKIDATVHVKTKRSNNPDAGKTLIVGSDEAGVLPVTDRVCPKCNKMQPVEYWEKQTRSADEPPTRFYRCTVCKYTWREYE